MTRTRRRLTALGLGTVIAAALAGIVIVAAEPLAPPRQPTTRADPFDVARARGDELRQAIVDDIAAGTQPSWAGTYGWSDGYVHHSLYVGLGGYFFETDSCVSICLISYGEIDASTDGQLALSQRVHLNLSPPTEPTARDKPVQEPEDPTPRRRPFRFELTMYSIPWGKERFLVPASQMENFCELATAEGRDAMRHANYPRKFTGEFPAMYGVEDLTGLPDVPPEFRRYLPASSSAPDERR